VGPAARWPSRLSRRPNLFVAKDQAAQGLQRENATLKRFLADTELEKVALTAPHDPDATLRSWLRHFGSGITTPVHKAGQSITRKCNAFGANKGFER
jgi:hypothetical protein